MSAAAGATAKITQSFSSVSPRTTTIDTGSGSNRRCAVGLISINALTGVTVTVGPDSLFQVSGTPGTKVDLASQMFAGAISDTTTSIQTVTVSWSSGNNTMAAYVLMITGSDQDNGGATANNGASPLSLGMVSAAGDLTVTVIVEDGFGACTTTFPPGTRDQHDEGPSVIASMDHGDGSLNPTHTWTKGGGDWGKGVMSGVNFRAAAAASSQPPMSREQQNMIAREAWLRKSGY